jgi:hypothetical protein
VTCRSFGAVSFGRSAVTHIFMKLFAHQVSVFTVFSKEMKNIHGAQFLRTTSRRKILHLVAWQMTRLLLDSEALLSLVCKCVCLSHYSEVYLLLTFGSQVVIICPTSCNIKKSEFCACVLFLFLVFLQTAVISYGAFTGSAF